MQASTWQFAPTLAGELGDLGDRIDHALRVLRRRADHEHGVRVDGGAIASTSAVQSSRTGTDTDRHVEQVGDLWNAAWALSASTISG
jgi:hypothetical protein